MNYTHKEIEKLVRENINKRTALGNGLYLTINNGSASFGYRYQINGRRRQLGLGAFCSKTNTLRMARVKLMEASILVKSGKDPLTIKREQKKEQQSERQQISRSFRKVATEYVESKKVEWKNRKHEQQWRNTLETYAFPIIGNIPVTDVETAHLLKILRPIWNSKTETATRVRNRIEIILSYAEAHKWRSGENPARWKGHLSVILPKPEKIKKVKNHPALPYSELPEFMNNLRKLDGVSARALEFLILTASRTSEVINARWEEFHIGRYTWIIPKERMKMNKLHRVPVSDPARNIINLMRRQNRQSEYIFTNPSTGRNISSGAMSSVLKRLGRKDITVHGFRSTFRDYVAERTNTPFRIAEQALAHKLNDSVEAAYQRSDLLEKRRHLMDVWGHYCCPPESNVIKLKKRMNWDGTI